MARKILYLGGLAAGEAGPCSTTQQLSELSDPSSMRIGDDAPPPSGVGARGSSRAPPSHGCQGATTAVSSEIRRQRNAAGWAAPGGPRAAAAGCADAARARRLRVRRRRRLGGATAPGGAPTPPPSEARAPRPTPRAVRDRGRRRRPGRRAARRARAHEVGQRHGSRTGARALLRGQEARVAALVADGPRNQSERQHRWRCRTQGNGPRGARRRRRAARRTARSSRPRRRRRRRFRPRARARAAAATTRRSARTKARDARDLGTARRRARAASSRLVAREAELEAEAAPRRGASITPSTRRCGATPRRRARGPADDAARRVAHEPRAPRVLPAHSNWSAAVPRKPLIRTLLPRRQRRATPLRSSPLCCRMRRGGLTVKPVRRARVLRVAAPQQVAPGEAGVVQSRPSFTVGPNLKNVAQQTVMRLAGASPRQR